MRRNPRVFHHAFASFNADTVVIPRWNRVAYWAGESVSIDLAAAHGGGTALDGAELRWSVDAAGLGGGERLARIDAAGVREARPAEFRAPEVADAEIHRVEFELDRGGDVLATSHLDLAVYPKRTAPAAGRLAVWADDPALRERFAALGYRAAESAASAAVIVATAPSEELAAKVREGARLVLLLDQPAELQPMFPHWQAVRSVSRHGSMWLGAWASSFSWLRRQGPFARLPGGPLIDHSFDRVIPDHVISGCNTWDFQSRVHAGIVIGWVHKAAALVVEREYGRGKFVATTFRLLQDAPGADPTATTLLDALVEVAVAPTAAESSEERRVTAPSLSA
jgi:hypothetical protein